LGHLLPWVNPKKTQIRAGSRPGFAPVLLAWQCRNCSYCKELPVVAFAAAQFLARQAVGYCLQSLCLRFQIQPTYQLEIWLWLFINQSILFKKQNTKNQALGTLTQGNPKHL